MLAARSPVLKVALAVAIVAVLAVDGSVVVARQGPGPAGPGGGGPPSAAARNLEAVLPQLIGFVEQTRGLPFRRPPKVDLLSDAEFERLLKEDDPNDPAPSDPADDELFVGILRALGLIQGAVDLDAVFEGEIADVVGFYDSRTKKLYARGVDLTPFVRLVLVHELTHALDDQHFNLDRPDLDDEAGAAFSALVEGDATWVERRWYDSRPPDEQEAIDKAEDASSPPAGSGPPSVFDRLFGFPYEIGPDLIDALRAAGGQERLDAAFATAPTTTEQALHPDKLLAGEGARRVGTPSADGEKQDEGVIGEALLYLMLDSAVDAQVARTAAAGWGGDRYVAWRAGERTCVRLNVVTDSPRDTSELVSALRAWSAANPRSTVRGTDPVVVTNCA